MGKKVNPKVVRLGITKTWPSTWFSRGKSYIKNVEQDVSIRKFMLKNFKEAGIDKVEIRPQAPIYLPSGIPIRIQFWAYSENVNMTAKLILEQKKSQDLYLDLGNFKFEGWKRMEARLEIPEKNIRLVQSLQIPLKVKGIRFYSNPFQTKGAFFIYLDQMTVLLETSTAIYSGSEIKDNWGD